MSVAQASPTVIWIEARDADGAASIEQTLLAAFRGGAVSLDSERFEVEFRPPDDSDLTVVQTLDVLEEWVAAQGLDPLLVHLFDLCYRIPVPAQASAEPRNATGEQKRRLLAELERVRVAPKSGGTRLRPCSARKRTTGKRAIPSRRADDCAATHESGRRLYSPHNIDGLRKDMGTCRRSRSKR